MRRWLAAALERIRSLHARSIELGFRDASAALAYWAFLTLFPLLIAFVGVLGSLDLFIGSGRAEEVRATVEEWVTENLSGPSGLGDVILDLLDTQRGAIAVVGLLTALWTISKGFAGLARALARIHGAAGGREGLTGLLYGLLLGVGTILMLTAVALVLALGPLLGFGDSLSGVADAIGTVWTMLSGPFLGAALFGWIVVVLKLGPGVAQPWLSVLPGAALVFVGWAALAVGTNFVVRLGLLEANPLLGVFGAVILVLGLLNLLARVLLIGALVNAERLPQPSAAPPETAAG